MGVRNNILNLITYGEEGKKRREGKRDVSVNVAFKYLILLIH